MTDMSQGEVARRLESLERRELNFVSKDAYERDVAHLQGDIREIKDSQKWTSRLLIGQFLTLIVALLVFLITTM